MGKGSYTGDCLYLQEPFSGFVRSLDGSRENRDPEPFNRVWTALRAVLRRELKKRGLWDLPPSYLGVTERSWAGVDGTTMGRPGRYDDALEELVADCYSYVFLNRLESLRGQLKLKHNIEGLVRLSIRSFLLERQRRFDPIGSRVYEVLRSSVRRAVREEACFVQAGDRKIRCDTIIAFEKGVPRRGQAADSLLRETACEWADDLLPDLVTCVGNAQPAVERRILDRLLCFPERGVGCLRFGGLLKPLKSEVRARWRTIFHHSLGKAAVEYTEGGLAAPSRSGPPETSFEERQSFEVLIVRIARDLEQLDANEGTVRYLLRLWEFLRAYALDDSEPPQRPLSQRKISAELRIPRDRLPGLCSTLRELIRKHRIRPVSRTRSIVSI